ncbi:MAG: SIR2 family NAD-dependent protein deacylase, partial [Acidobacteriota bacterium]
KAMRDAQPNAGHLAFADLERRGKLLALITQNIDRLHQRAGNTGVIELHGTISEVECLNCHERSSMDTAAERVAGGDPAPDCPHCGGDLKPATIFFGQVMPTQAIEQAVKACQACDVLIAVGSSLGVYPAASLPELARRAGAHLIIINRTPTPFDLVADLVINEEIGQSLPALVGLK